jgi:hypothetical protein
MWKEEVMDQDQRSKNVAELFGEGLGDAALVMPRPFSSFSFAPDKSEGLFRRDLDPKSPRPHSNTSKF